MTRSPRTVLAAAASAQASVSVVAFGLPAVGPDLREAYGLSLTMLGAALAATILGSGTFLLAAGLVVDRYGARRSMLAGTAIGAGGLAAAGFAPGQEALVGLLFLSGSGSAVVPIAGTRALFDRYEAARRGWALGVRQMAVPVGGTLAALLLPVLVAVGGIRLALVASAALVAGAGLAFAWVADAGARGGGRAAFALSTLWRTPGMRRLLVVAALYIVVLQAVVAYTVPAARAAGFSPLVAGAAFVLVNVVAGVARVVWGQRADRGGGRRRVRTLVEAGAVAALGAVAFAFALDAGSAVLLAAAAFLAFGALGWNALVYVTAGERVPRELAGQSVALAATVVFVVAALCTPPLGALAEHAGWDAFWLTAAALAAAGAALAATLPVTAGEPLPAASRP
ncbi:MAG TPA: MFS transporter [Gaiellaceae bacterium]|nr:MFS transporter [Gaiellaceae bacterium]